MPFLDSSRHLFRVWRAGARSSIVREMEFRANFLSGLFRQVLWLFSFIFFIDVIFQNTSQLAGWGKADVLIVLALSRFIEGIIDTLFSRNIARFPESVRTGMFDYSLTKPVPSQFIAAFSRIAVQSIGNILAGIVLLGYAFSIATAPPLLTWPVFILLAFLGISAYYSVLLLAVSLVFWLEQFEAFHAISHLVSEPLTVPFDVFPPIPKTALTYLVPLAFVVFVPAQALTGRLAWWQVPVAILIAGIFVLLANLTWRAGLRRYSSASS